MSTSKATAPGKEQRDVAERRGMQLCCHHSLARLAFGYTIGAKRMSDDFQQVLVGTAGMLAEPIRLLSN